MSMRRWSGSARPPSIPRTRGDRGARTPWFQGGRRPGAEGGQPPADVEVAASPAACAGGRSVAPCHRAPPATSRARRDGSTRSPPSGCRPSVSIEGVAEELRAAMPVDALVMAATDPDTLLGLGAGVVHGMPHTVCAPVLGVRVRGPRLQQVQRPRARPAAGRRPARRDRRAPRAQRAVARAADADGRRRGAARDVQRRRPRLGAAPPQPRRDRPRLRRRGDRVRRDDRTDRRPCAAAVADLASGPERRRPRARDGDRRCRQPPRVRDPGGGGLVRGARVGLPPARSGARPRRAERGHGRRAGGPRARRRRRDRRGDAHARADAQRRLAAHPRVVPARRRRDGRGRRRRHRAGQGQRGRRR